MTRDDIKTFPREEKLAASMSEGFLTKARLKSARLATSQTSSIDLFFLFFALLSLVALSRSLA
jgi:hypothetical protein